jgi:phosphoribosyl-dephospho-CoA transferase
VDSNLTGVNERDQRARHMKGESIELEAHIPLGRKYKENFIF